MRLLSLLGAARPIISLLACTFCHGSLGVGWLATAQAQSVPKSLEEGGTDAAMKGRKNNWTVGVAGGALFGTHNTLPHGDAEGLRACGNLPGISFVTQCVA